MGYRPITDIWFLARAKLTGGHKYYGAYLGGFPERARAMLAATLDEPVLHVCGGMARHYPYRRGFGPNDRTLDIDPLCEPDYVQDARAALPAGFKAILMDPPYSEDDAAKYRAGASVYPKPNALLKNALDAVAPGGRVGLIHYILPSPPKGAVFVAAVGVICGFNNRIRIFSVFEKGALDEHAATRSDPDHGKIGPGHVCEHGIRWPHSCQPCDEAAWATRSETTRDGGEG